MTALPRQKPSGERSKPQSGHRHLWRVLPTGRRSGGSADDEEVDEEYLVCQVCGEVRTRGAE